MGHETPDGSQLTNAELVRHLFGNPFDPEDRGLLGDIRAEVKTLNSRVDRILRLGWAVLIVLLIALFTLAGDLFMRLTSAGYHP